MEALVCNRDDDAYTEGAVFTNVIKYVCHQRATAISTMLHLDHGFLCSVVLLRMTVNFAA